jgi:hypothetical protein
MAAAMSRATPITVTNQPVGYQVTVRCHTRRAECEGLLASRNVGRLGLVMDGHPYVIPMHYATPTRASPSELELVASVGNGGRYAHRIVAPLEHIREWSAGGTVAPSS